ncbi:MAG: hypothetical protein KIS85_03485 [Anaerolineales bacterium]|nr:hypothetical protein [Anaerolineales bacterium]
MAVYIATLLGAPAPNHVLARLLGLGNAYVLAAILGGLMGLWLAWGGKARIARIYGLLLGIFAGWLVWQFGQPHVWLIELVLASAFGPEAAVYTSFVTLFILFWVVRTAAEWGKKGMELLTEYFLRWEIRREIARSLATAEPAE